MWSRLPSNLRTILGTALVLGIGVTAAAFTLSFFALRAVASNPQLEFGKGHAWLFPIALDMALVFAEVLLLGASMVTGYNRAIPILLVLAFGIGTTYFNVTRVPDQVRLVTAVPPVASILMTIGLAYLMKMLTTISGGVQAYQAPPPVYGMLGTPDGPIRGAIWRPGVDPHAIPSPDPYAPPALEGQTPTWAPSQIPQNGQGSVGGNGDQGEATKRRQVEAHLATLGPDQLGRLAGLGPRAAARELTATLNGQGVAVSERYVQQIWDDWTAAARQQANGGRRKH
jgi:Protein of unknown function (DUF2637)